MTTTVTIRTRAVGAEVKNGADTTTVPPRSEHTINVEGTGSFSITEAQPQADEPAPMTKRNPADPEPEQPEGEKPAVDGSKFDHDGDGKVGGSKPKR